MCSDQIHVKCSLPVGSLRVPPTGGTMAGRQHPVRSTARVSLFSSFAELHLPLHRPGRHFLRHPLSGKCLAFHRTLNPCSTNECSGIILIRECRWHGLDCNGDRGRRGRGAHGHGRRWPVIAYRLRRVRYSLPFFSRCFCGLHICQRVRELNRRAPCQARNGTCCAPRGP